LGLWPRREILIDETKRSYELTLDGLTLPKSALMELDNADAALKRIDLAANLLGSAELIGGAQNCIDYTVEYLNTRKQFGKLIGSYQALKHTVVDAYVTHGRCRRRPRAVFCSRPRHSISRWFWFYI